MMTPTAGRRGRDLKLGLVAVLVMALMVELHLAAPDLTATMEDLVISGDRVVGRFVYRGTHAGEFMGIPPTGKSFTARNADSCRFTHDGLICEHWGVFDVAALMRKGGLRWTVSRWRQRTASLSAAGGWPGIATAWPRNLRSAGPHLGGLGKMCVRDCGAQDLACGHD